MTLRRYSIGGWGGTTCAKRGRHFFASPKSDKYSDPDWLIDLIGTEWLVPDSNWLKRKSETSQRHTQLVSSACKRLRRLATMSTPYPLLPSGRSKYEFVSRINGPGAFGELWRVRAHPDSNFPFITRYHPKVLTPGNVTDVAAIRV